MQPAGSGALKGENSGLMDPQSALHGTGERSKPPSEPLHQPGSGQQMEERDGRIPDINSQSVDDKDSQS